MSHVNFPLLYSLINGNRSKAPHKNTPDKSYQAVSHQSINLLGRMPPLTKSIYPTGRTDVKTLATQQAGNSHWRGNMEF